MHETAKQLEECVSKLLLKDNEITKLKAMLNQKSNQVEYAQVRKKFIINLLFMAYNKLLYFKIYKILILLWDHNVDFSSF